MIGSDILKQQMKNQTFVLIIPSLSHITLSLTEVRFLFHFSLGWPGRKQDNSFSSFVSNDKSNLPNCRRINAITSSDSQ